MGGIYPARDDGFDIRVDPAATTNGIPEELEDIIVHQPAPADTVGGVSMPFAGAVGRDMSFLGAIRYLAKTAEPNQPAAYHSSKSYHDSLLKHKFGVLLS